MYSICQYLEVSCNGKWSVGILTFISNQYRILLVAIMASLSTIDDFSAFERTNKPKPNYLLRIDLEPEILTNPRIFRTLSCPALSTFHELHEAMLIAFDWSGTRSYEFDVETVDTFTWPSSLPKSHPIAKGLDVRAKKSAEHVVEREHSLVYVPNERTSLRILDRQVETLDDPRFRMTPNRSVNGGSMNPKMEQCCSLLHKLCDVLDKDSAHREDLVYTYDLRKNVRWKHLITFRGLEAANPQFKCTDGYGHGCGEGINGARGWKQILNTYRMEAPTREQRMAMMWYEQICVNGDKEGLHHGRDTFWDLVYVNTLLKFSLWYPGLNYQERHRLRPQPQNATL